MGMNPDSVTNCMRCDESLERGYSTRFSKNECKEVICFKCDGQENLDDYMKDGIIRTHFMMDCMLSCFDIMRPIFGRGYQDPNDESQVLETLGHDIPDTDKIKLRVQLASIRIQNKIKEFDAKVWFKGLQDQIHATECRGVSAKLGKKHDNFCVLTWTCAGRTMITFEDDHAMVTAVADEDSKESRTGLHGICATGEQAIALIEKAITLFENGTLKFKDDEKVSMI